MPPVAAVQNELWLASVLCGIQRRRGTPQCAGKFATQCRCQSFSGTISQTRSPGGGKRFPRSWDYNLGLKKRRYDRISTCQSDGTSKNHPTIPSPLLSPKCRGLARLEAFTADLIRAQLSSEGML